MAGVVDFPFSIHQDLWHDAWVAATSTTRGRKKQVDFNVRQRVLRFLDGYGPQSSAPLTLRVYGTMLKGFSVINNERARMLQGDCERVVLLFAQQPFGEDGKGMKLPAAKRQRVDALTLDLDLAKVREAEAFDWSQAPLEEGVLLQLRADAEDDFTLALVSTGAEGAGSAAGGVADVPLLQQAPLLDEAFPPLDVPQIEAEEQAAAAKAAALVATATADANGAPAGAGNASALVPRVDGSVMGDGAAVGTDGTATAEGQTVLPVVSAKLQRHRAARGFARPPVPGHVFGFDLETVLSVDTSDEWQSDVGSISGRCMEAAEYAELVASESSVPDHLGPLLRLFVDPPAETLRPRGDGSAELPISGLSWLRAPRLQEAAGDAPTAGNARASAASAGEWPALPPTSAVAPPKGATGPPSAAPKPLGVAAEDAFRPYVPEPPLSCACGADVELATLLSGPQAAAAVEEGAAHAQSGPKYDHQTARVAKVFHRFLGAAKQGDAGAGACARRALALDDLVPPSTTDPATAARAFHALLTLATVGEVRVEQQMPYGPISIVS